MQTSLAKSIGATSMLLVAIMTGACGNISRNVAADGKSAGQLVWPSPSSTTPTHKNGSYPNVSDLRLVKVGMSKQQIAQLIGAPHFSEGVWGVREWNYLFNFRTHGSDDVTQCQYKVLFDEQKLSRSFYWQPQSCAALLDEPMHERQEAKEDVFTLSTDTLFSFDRYATRDIKAGGLVQLDLLAATIASRGNQVRHIQIIGYTDRLGTDAYNKTLSDRRANTVKAYIVQQGVSEQQIGAEGRGKNESMKECQDADRSKLITCLAPNRRVEVRVEGVNNSNRH
jgi:OmpA-OmpF porin, OOP family